MWDLSTSLKKLADWPIILKFCPTGRSTSFLITQVKLALALFIDVFDRKYPYHPPPIFMKGDINIIQSFQIKKLYNKYIVKKEYIKIT